MTDIEFGRGDICSINYFYYLFELWFIKLDYLYQIGHYNHISLYDINVIGV